MLFFICCIILCMLFEVLDVMERRHEKKNEEELFQKELLEIKKREETDVVFRHRKIPDERLADEYTLAKYNNDKVYMEELKEVMIERSKKASFEEAYDYYYKIYEEWRNETNYGCF